MSVEDLAGVGPVSLKFLREAGYETIESIAIANPEDLIALGITDDQAHKIIGNARSEIGKIGPTFQTALDLMHEYENMEYLTTGVPTLDTILGRGLESGRLYEIYGDYGHGKSNLCFQLCVTALLPKDKMGLDANVLFIDTENTFSPHRVTSIAKRFGLNAEDVLKRVTIANAFNTSHQMLLLQHANKKIKEENIRLIIVDSLTAHFRSEYIGREMLARRQQELNRHVRLLHKLVRIFNAVGVVTTQVVANPQVSYYGPMQPTPVGGHVLGHAPAFILRIWKPPSMSEKRFITIEKSSHIAEQRIELTLTEDGFHEAEEKKPRKTVTD